MSMRKVNGHPRSPAPTPPSAARRDPARPITVDQRRLGPQRPTGEHAGHGGCAANLLGQPMATPAGVGPQHDVGIQTGKSASKFPAAGGGEEGVDDLTLAGRHRRRRGGRTPAHGGGPGWPVFLAFGERPEHGGNLVEGHAEHVVEHEGQALPPVQGPEDHEQGRTQRIGQQGLYSARRRHRRHRVGPRGRRRGGRGPGRRRRRGQADRDARATSTASGGPPADAGGVAGPDPCRRRLLPRTGTSDPCGWLVLNRTAVLGAPYAACVISWRAFAEREPELAAFGRRPSHGRPGLPRHRAGVRGTPRPPGHAGRRRRGAGTCSWSPRHRSAGTSSSEAGTPCTAGWRTTTARAASSSSAGRGSKWPTPPSGPARRRRHVRAGGPLRAVRAHPRGGSGQRHTATCRSRPTTGGRPRAHGRRARAV